MATIKTLFGIVTYPETIESYSGNNSYRVVASLWEKNGKSRVYFKVIFAGQSPVDCGWMDGQTGESAISSRPVSWGKTLNAQVSFKKSDNNKQTGTYNTGFGYYGTAKDAAKGFDGIE